MDELTCTVVDAMSFAMTDNGKPEIAEIEIGGTIPAWR